MLILSLTTGFEMKSELVLIFVKVSGKLKGHGENTEGF